jgi:hypothetical protein
VAQLLRPEGYFIYSTHNIHYKRVPVWTNHFFVRELIPPSIRRANMLFKNVAGRLRNFSAQEHNYKNFAYVNDPAFDLITVYVDIAGEIARLGKL